MTNEALFRLFSKFGNVISARIMVEKATGRSRGFGESVGVGALCVQCSLILSKMGRDLCAWPSSDEAASLIVGRSKRNVC